ncbi:MAG: FAD-binding and (Fe-S)-binding domain-containing protein [Holophaga sp.]|nr:FAD-binding and (Fe-S)-binding domain-containing protein [Holophaga sp.]
MKTSTALRPSLEAIVGAGRVLDRPAERVAWSADAGFYQLIPQAVVFAGSVAEVQALFRLSREAGIPMTFRAAGTSLSGQAISDGLLVEVARHWRSIQVLDGGARVRVQPGVIGAHVNRALLAYSAKIGPDPASISTCTVGGILSNNSSGMCCGVVQNAYHTLDSLTFVLPSGTVIDTAAPDADQAFRGQEPALAQGLLELKAELEGNAALAARIRAKYRMKNTVGYSLNAFLDFDRPVDIFRNLLVGSEGTLAFIAEAVLRTVPTLPVKVTGLLLFPDVHAACRAVTPLRDAGAAAVELMDRGTLRAVENQPGAPAGFRTLPPGTAALLAEFQAAAGASPVELERKALEACHGLPLLEPAAFTPDPGRQAELWKLRLGAFPSVGSIRPRGTSAITEDLVFPLPALADAVLDLTRLFVKHGYDNGIVHGHAKDGNMHFVLAQSFNDPAAVNQYARFMEDLVDLVVRKYDGALKGEHGTGRNMAPYVETEWGPEAKQVMERLKALVDPDRLLNPGVILNPDPMANVVNLKAMPVVEDEVDKCIECGLCEPMCPSRELTLTPRQRIVLRREMARLETTGEDPWLLGQLQGAYRYLAQDTCAADGLCATACPVAIDTGSLIKRLRRQNHSALAHGVAVRVQRHFARVEPLLRLGLRSGHLVQRLFGAGAMVAATRLLRAVARQATPQWSPELPRAAGRLPRAPLQGAQAVYFPACISRTMGALPGETGPSLPEVLVTLAARAGVPLHVPQDTQGVCCGVPFSSKGYAQAHRLAVNQAVERFWAWSQQGRLPVVMDTSPCAQGMKNARPYLSAENQDRFDRMRILDPVEFAWEFLLPRLTVRRKSGRVVLHPVCSLTRMGLTPKLEALAAACAEEVLIPRDAGCCGFAGDRGLLFPELTASATRAEAAEVMATDCDGHYSSSRTCEIGVTRATGRIYRSFLYLLESATRDGAEAR